MITFEFRSSTEILLVRSVNRILTKYRLAVEIRTVLGQGPLGKGGSNFQNKTYFFKANLDDHKNFFRNSKMIHCLEVKSEFFDELVHMNFEPNELP